jgi:hypothetical protein
MTETIRKFVDPETGKPLDREWLDHEVEIYVKTKPQRPRCEYSPRSEREIYDHFAPTGGGWAFSNNRPSWQSKNRRVKRQMLAASLRRLLAIGKLTIYDTYYPNRKSMNGMVRRNRESDRRLFGQDHDGLIRYFTAGSILDALVKALGDVE